MSSGSRVGGRLVLRARRRAYGVTRRSGQSRARFRVRRRRPIVSPSDFALPRRCRAAVFRAACYAVSNRYLPAYRKVRRIFGTGFRRTFTLQPPSGCGTVGRVGVTYFTWYPNPKGFSVGLLVCWGAHGVIWVGVGVSLGVHVGCFLVLGLDRARVAVAGQTAHGLGAARVGTLGVAAVRSVSIAVFERASRLGGGVSVNAAGAAVASPVSFVSGVSRC